jgi:hypothetical protein
VVTKTNVSTTQSKRGEDEVQHCWLRAIEVQTQQKQQQFFI